MAADMTDFADRLTWGVGDRGVLSGRTPGVSETIQIEMARLLAAYRAKPPQHTLSLGERLRPFPESDAFASRRNVFDALSELYLSHNRPRDRQIADRLNELYADAIEEDEAIRAGSLRQFLNFFLEHPTTGLPKITLTPDRTLRIRWLGEGGDFFAVEFTGKPLLKLAAAITRAPGETSSYFASEIPSRIATTARALGASLG